MFACPCVRIFLAAVTLALPIENVSGQNAPTGEFTEALVQIVFRKESPQEHISPEAVLAAGKEINEFFKSLSYGKLDFRVITFAVQLPKTYADYVACGSDCDYFEDAIAEVRKDAPVFLKDVKGVSLLVVPRYNLGADKTGLQLRSFPGLMQQLATSTLTEGTDANTPLGPSQVNWGGWAHEFGHQLEVYANSTFSGSWLGHPSGYASGYDLMDSCYPCHQGGYGLLGAPTVGGTRLVFPGWLDDAHVDVVPIPSSGPIAKTHILPPLSQNITTPVVQVMKVPVDSKRYFLIQARLRHEADALLQNSPKGISSEGVQIHFIDEDAEYPVKRCDREPGRTCVMYCDPTPDAPDSRCTPSSSRTGTDPWPFILWGSGDTLVDVANDIKIAVESQITVGEGGYQVTVSRGVPPNHPDLFIIPWLTPPNNSYETADIWVDSSCNGYGVLKYGRAADTEQTVNQSGDDPCLNHDNMIFARIRNIGDAASTATTARIQVSNPLGVGVTGDWQTIQDVLVPSIPAGQSIIVSALWTPKVNVTAQQLQMGHFAFHSCIQVIIQTSSGELITTNNAAQENIDVFEAVASGTVSASGVARYPVLHGSFRLYNPYKSEGRHEYFFVTNSELPTGWTYIINNGKRSVTLDPEESIDVPVDILPTEAPVGKMFRLQVGAFTMRPLPDIQKRGHIHPSWYHAGGANLYAHTVVQTGIEVSASKSIWSPAIGVKGRLTHRRRFLAVTIDYSDDAGHAASQILHTDFLGRFRGSPVNLGFKPTRARAFWQGNLKYSSAMSDLVPIR